MKQLPRINSVPFWVSPYVASTAVLLLIAMLDCADAQTRTFDCILEPRLKIKLATPVSGVLKEVLADRGDVVSKDQVVARLESAVDQAQLELAKAKAESDATVKAREARLTFLTKKRERTTSLMAKGAASAAALDEIESDFGVASQDLREAQANLRISQLEVVRAEEVLKLRSVRSPIDGVVAERNLLGGEFAYDQAPIMTIAQINPLNVEVFVPIALYGTIKIGMEAAVTGEEPVGGRYVAKVEVIDPLIDARSGTFGIRLLLSNPDNKIPAGLRCRVEFPLAP
ncbi:efflux RND transporter periplasmic adaptor subunit [Bradyrhizobium sp. 62]|uniref:efflux RND transporter periplasmic adaptor subunit n=1 Tax=Bradyrhizobium sp. 62 TaxID=1043588 RepID=UPI001FF84ED4|nr:efflux RND transporter periplasmic adaptor subunit [Bradyrhizobium sp. 62]